MAKIYIGIDPDLEASGFCVYSKDGKRMLELKDLPFFDLIEQIEAYTEGTGEAIVVLESGWLINKSNWRSGEGANVRERIAGKVGQNHAVGKLIEQYLKKKQITYTLKNPLGKVTKTYFRQLTGYKDKKLTQEMIDAAMLVFGR